MTNQIEKHFQLLSDDHNNVMALMQNRLIDNKGTVKTDEVDFARLIVSILCSPQDENNPHIINLEDI